MPLKLKQKGGGEFCPAGFICMQSVHLLIIIGATIVILFLYLFPVENNRYSSKKSRDTPKKRHIEVDDEDSSDYYEEKESLPKEKIIVHHDYVGPRQMIVSKERERLINPLLPPERSYVLNNYGVPVNVPTRGYSGGYQQVGILYKKSISDPTSAPGNNTESNILPLYGQPTFSGSNKWNYYTSSDKFTSLKIPVQHKNKECTNEHGCQELYDGDSVAIPAYNGDFEVKIYGYDSPRYLPHIV
uniref:Uncharacterized protein n=1 Tax=viral metagenome TaxID=1070528 RepID=A0A6C0E854_9ZZZZ